MSVPKVIKFLDLRAINASLHGDLSEASERVLASGHYIGGPEVQLFEQAFAEYCGVSGCRGVANGLDALRLSLIAHGIGPGDEVIVPAHTFIASWLAVSAVGATPVPVEADDTSMNMDWRAAAAAVRPATKAIMIVHLYGRPSDIDPFARLCAEHGLVLIEDAAQAHGASYKGTRIGGHGNTTAWSFYPGKNLGAIGDAGAVTTPWEEIAEKVALLGNYGAPKKYQHDLEGVNSRLDPLQAAFLAAKLETLEASNERRRQIANIYLAEITNPFIRLPPADDNVQRSSWHLFVVRCTQRERFQNHLAACGVESLVHYPTPPHLQPAYTRLGLEKGAFPVTEQIANEVVSLPIGPHMTLDDARRVVEVVNAFV